MNYCLTFFRRILSVFAGLFFFVITVYCQPSTDHSYGKELTGQWIGPLKVNGMELRIAFNFHPVEDSIAVTMDSPDQGVEGIKAKIVYIKNDSVSIIVPQAFGRFDGHIMDSIIHGRWIQGFQKLPVTLVKMGKAVKINRPQEQLMDITYISKEVTFKNPLANIELAGTLTLPDTIGKFPAVILITGSGPQNRDEEIFGHKPFLVIADHLTREGFAVLRYDDRGVGKSQGSFSKATTFDFALDAESALSFLRTQPHINSQKIGLIGHSEGGIIAYMVASEKSDQVDFIVSLAGPAIPGDSLLMAQLVDLLKTSGLSEKKIEKQKKLEKSLLSILKNEPNDDSAKVKMEDVFMDYYKDTTIDNSIQSKIEMDISGLLSPWYRKFISLDPALYISGVKCPVLALFGSKDLQVPAKKDSLALKRIFDENGNKQYKIYIIPDLNHLFQHAITGLPAEYGKIEETFALEALQVMSEWMKKVTALK